jgi:ABC-type branched-subunit amino acid transport system substrate-binding protein
LLSCRRLAALALLLPLLAAGCGERAGAPNIGLFGPGVQGGGQGPAPLPQVARTRVGLLLPLSGSNRALGEAMLNAAQLALFDQADPRVEFLPQDTGGTAAGASEATRRATAAGARVLAGPLTSAETGAAAILARAAGLPLLAFTNDLAAAGRGIYVLGVTPTQQVERMVSAAAGAGAQRFALLAPDDEFGRRAAQALRARLQLAGLPAPFVLLHPPRIDMAQAVRDIANLAGEAPVDALILAQTGPNARNAAAAVPAVFPKPPRLLGIAQWALDPSLAREPALAGAWFPAPDPQARASFETRYTQAFGDRPPRLAGVAYDAAGLAARAAREGGPLPVGEAFMGADGPIRLLADGQLARGLAVFAFDPAGEPRLVQPAPVPGLAGS